MENTKSGITWLSKTWDHLHIRGEYNSKVTFDIPISGSSPHTWRIPATKAFTKDEVGIISTYVENTQNDNRQHINL